MTTTRKLIATAILAAGILATTTGCYQQRGIFPTAPHSPCTTQTIPRHACP